MTKPKKAKAKRPVDAVDKVADKADEVDGELVEETAEPVEVDAPPITLDDVVNRVKGIVNNARDQGVSTVARRFFAGLEGFLGGVAGDDEKKPPRKG